MRPLCIKGAGGIIRGGSATPYFFAFQNFCITSGMQKQAKNENRDSQLLIILSLLLASYLVIQIIGA